MSRLIDVVCDTCHIFLFSEMIYLVLTDDRPVWDKLLSRIGQFRKEKVAGDVLAIFGAHSNRVLFACVPYHALNAESRNNLVGRHPLRKFRFHIKYLIISHQALR
jgi:hypothetical protein